MLWYKGRFVSKKHVKSLQSLCRGQQGKKKSHKRERKGRGESTAESFRTDHSTNVTTRPKFSVQWREEESLIWANTTNDLQSMCIQAPFVGHNTCKSVWPDYSVFTVICPNCQHQNTVASSTTEGKMGKRISQ